MNEFSIDDGMRMYAPDIFDLLAMLEPVKPVMNIERRAKPTVVDLVLARHWFLIPSTLGIPRSHNDHKVLAITGLADPSCEAFQTVPLYRYIHHCAVK
ncbi:MAG: hypothetical protein ACREPG_11370 [Candidatus Binatia bacterium]